VTTNRIEKKTDAANFDAFEQGGGTVTSKYGGLGLGLAICKRVIDLHGGAIEAQSEGKDAARNSRHARRDGDFDARRSGPVPRERAARMKHVQILFVEDHEDTARVLGRILRNAASISATPDRGGGALARGTRRFDLLISDLGLPDGSGLDLMKALREAQGMKGIALSGFGTDDDVRPARRLDSPRI